MRVYIVITIIIIQLEPKVLLRIKKSKVGVYDLQLLRRYAVKKIHSVLFIYIYKVVNYTFI
jgi:hypothetical protein